MAQHPESIESSKTDLSGLEGNFTADLRAGFSISLIALPLSLGIALASNFPPTAGLIAAIVGGILVSRINGSHVTINGPAAGLIVVNLAAVESLGQGDPYAGYLYAIAAVFVAGILVFLIGTARAGKLVDIFPTSVIHGMLAYIGIVIFAKMLPSMLGVVPEVEKIWGSDVIGSLAAIPPSFTEMLPSIALIGFLSLFIMVVHPFVKLKWVQMIPAPLWVVIFAIPLGAYLNLEALEQQLNRGPGEELLLTLPDHPLDGIAWIGGFTPDFSKFMTGIFWYTVISIGLVTAIESALSTKAVDQLDPYKRHSDISKDLRGVGMGSAVSGLLGGLPMIAEIVRSKANVLMGARSGWSNFFHGVFILIFLVVLAPLMHMIPIAALAAIMVYVGYKLAEPAEFLHTYEIGRDQFIYFIITLVTCLFTNLLEGVFIGVLFAFFHKWLIMGVPSSALFKPPITVEQNRKNGSYQVKVKGGAIFTNYLALKRQLDQLPKGKKILIDFSEAKVVDFNTQSALTDYAKLYAETGGSMELIGLERLTPYSAHPQSTRYRLSNA